MRKLEKEELSEHLRIVRVGCHQTHLIGHHKPDQDSLGSQQEPEAHLAISQLVSNPHQKKTNPSVCRNEKIGNQHTDRVGKTTSILQGKIMLVALGAVHLDESKDV